MDLHPQSPFALATSLSGKPWGVSRDTVLIIEDNEGIAGLLTVLLGKCGLNVIWGQSGREAVDKFNQHRDLIALVLSDCRLPDGDGRDFCQIFREQLPELPLLLSSGSVAYLNLGPIKSGRMVRFMQKPYAPSEMLAHVGKLQAEAMKASATISAGFV